MKTNKSILHSADLYRVRRSGIDRSIDMHGGTAAAAAAQLPAALRRSRRRVRAAASSSPGGSPRQPHLLHQQARFRFNPCLNIYVFIIFLSAVLLTLALGRRHYNQQQRRVYDETTATPRYWTRDDPYWSHLFVTPTLLYLCINIFCYHLDCDIII